MSGRPDYDVGDLVVCVHASPIWQGHVSPTQKGKVYQVTDIVPSAVDLGEYGVLLVGVPIPSEFVGFWSGNFRKVDPLPDALTSLLASKPGRESIPA